MYWNILKWLVTNKYTRIVLIIGFLFLIGKSIFLSDETVTVPGTKSVTHEQEKKFVEDLSIVAHTMCKIIVENSLSSYIDIEFPLGSRKVFKKENQRYIVKDYVLYLDNGIKTKSQWHCDLQYTGGDSMNGNNWKILNMEIITLNK